MNDKVCIVTGANSGLGKATALGLAKLGAIVVLACRNKERGEVAQGEIAAATGNKAVDLILVDLSAQQSIYEMVANFKHLLFTYDLARRLAGTGITANAIHPGLVKSNLLNDASPIMRWLSHLISSSPDKAAETPVYYAVSPEVEGISGKFFKGRKQIESNTYSKDTNIQKRLWDVSLELIKSYIREQ